MPCLQFLRVLLLNFELSATKVHFISFHPTHPSPSPSPVHTCISSFIGLLICTCTNMPTCQHACMHAGNVHGLLCCPRGTQGSPVRVTGLVLVANGWTPTQGLAASRRPSCKRGCAFHHVQRARCLQLLPSHPPRHWPCRGAKIPPQVEQVCWLFFVFTVVFCFDCCFLFLLLFFVFVFCFLFFVFCFLFFVFCFCFLFLLLFFVFVFVCWSVWLVG